MHYSSQLDEQFTVVFMTVSHSTQMLLKLEKCIPISHVTLETVHKYANIERPTSSQLYASVKLNCISEALKIKLTLLNIFSKHILGIIKYMTLLKALQWLPGGLYSRFGF